MVDPSDYVEIPANRHDIHAGALLFPTTKPIVANGGTSQDFVLEQGGDEDTFVFMFGVRPMKTLMGMQVGVLEGVFLGERGPGFLATWDFEQLMREADLGGWRVVTTDEVLEGWVSRIEARMNR